MRPIVIVLIVVALALAGGAAYMVSLLLTQQGDVAVEDQPQSETQIMIAARDLPAGTILQDADMVWRAWPSDGLQPDYVVRQTPDLGFVDFTGSAVRAAIRIGEPVTAARVFKRTEAGFLSGALAPGMRGVSVQVDDVTGTSGFVLPGDRVDVIMTQRFSEFDPQINAVKDRFVVQTILRNVRVLAVDQTLDDVAATAQRAKTVTLEVNPSDSEVISLAAQMGDLTLAVRSLSLEEDPELQPFQADYNVSRYLGRTVRTENRVAAAARDLEPGTLIRAQDLSWVTVSASSLTPGSYIEGSIEVERLRGALIRVPIAKGTILMGDDVYFPDADGFVYSALGEGMVGYSIGIAPESFISGRISAGDRVDVIMTAQLQERGGMIATRTLSETVLENVRVIAIDRTYDRNISAWKLGDTATLEVTSEGAERLAAARAMGTLTLALRGEGVPQKLNDFTTDYELSRALTAFAWGQTGPLPPGFENLGQTDGAVDERDMSGAPEIAPIPAPTLAAPVEAEEEAEPEFVATGQPRSVKVYRGGGATIYRFTE
ncbi:MAG: Flp pilus assembly protein CpaB [Alphaproteobacteria bacterium]